MAKTYRVGFALLVHDHVWGELKHWQNLPSVKIVAVGDVNQELCDKFKAETGVDKLYDS